MRQNLLIGASIAAALALSSAAVAQTSATAAADLNIRSGPGPNYSVVGVIPADGAVTVDGCLEGSRWCRVSHEGTEGWAYSGYLTAELGGSRVVIEERRADVGVPVVTYEGSPAGATSGAVGGALVGALLGGPIGAAVGGIAGATTGSIAGAAIDPPAPVRTYVTTNRVEPVYLEGEVVVGAGVPETVELRTIPDYEYRYVYINELPVLVEPDTRRIVHVIR